MTLLHLATASDWDPQSPTYRMSTRGVTISQVGFLHASRDRAQLDGVVGRFYGDVIEPLLVLELDEDALAQHGLEVRYEPAVPSDPDSELFPHVYGGDLPTEVVTAAHPYER